MSPRTADQNAQLRQQRRQQLLEAARTVFAEKGFHGTRMSDIARAAEVSQGTLYHYFGSKDDLFLALLEVWTEKLAQVVTQVPEAGQTARDKFWLINRIGVSFLEINADLLPVMVEFWAYALRNPEAAASFRNFFHTMQHVMETILAEGIASGEFRPIDREVLAILPLVVLDGVILLSATLGREAVQPEALVRQTQQLIFEGLLSDAVRTEEAGR